MSQLRSSTSLESDIQMLLKHYGDIELAADALIKKYENEKLSLSELETIATFLLHGGFYSTLTHFFARRINPQVQIPWGHLLEALFLSTPAIGPQIKRALLDGATEQKLLGHLSRSRFLDSFEESMIEVRQNRKNDFQKTLRQKKQSLLEEMELMKSQGLHQEEEKVLELLARFFPEDPEVENLYVALRERRAMALLANKPQAQKHKVFIPFHNPKDPETQALLAQIMMSMQQSLQETAPESQELANKLATDFSVAMLIWEDFPSALELLNLIHPPNIDGLWWRAEILLEAHRFAELLQHLTQLESFIQDVPDRFYAIQYLRAQALWGLNQKQKAFEIMEALVLSSPHYRSASALLDEWREEGL